MNNHHDEYDEAQLPDWVRFDPEYTEPPPRFSSCMFAFWSIVVLGIVFWSGLRVLVWAVNTLIGGG